MKVAQEIDVDGVTIIINTDNKLEAKIPPSSGEAFDIKSLPEKQWGTGQYVLKAIFLNTPYRVDVTLPVSTAQNFTIKGNIFGVNETAGDIAITHINGGINVVTSDRVSATNNITSNRITIIFV